MAIDTVVLRSPFILEELAQKIEQECTLRQGIDLKTGDLIYCITTGNLQGSYDSNISISVKREIWVSGEDGKGSKVESSPYIQLECSIHKAMMGHNVFGGPFEFRSSVYWLLNLVESLIDTTFPPADLWEVWRVDVAEVYELPSFEAVQEYFKGLNTAEYPRRSVNRYGSSGIYAQGSTTALKFYHKGPEFQKHDRKRLIKHLETDQIFNLQQQAHKIIRVEVEIKSRKLEYDFGHKPLVAEITDEYLNNVHDHEVTRFLKEGAKEMKIVRDAHEVEKRLYSVYDSRIAGILLGTWFKLSTLGEEYVKKSVPKTSFYRQRNQLKDAGVSWLGTDVVLVRTSLIPADFSPVRSDQRRLVQQHQTVTEKLASIRHLVPEVPVRPSTQSIQQVM